MIEISKRIIIGMPSGSKELSTTTLIFYVFKTEID